MSLKRLEAHHLIAIGYLSQPKQGGKTHEEIAKECGVHRSTIFEWKKDPLFEKELKKQMLRNVLPRLPEVLAAVPDIIIRDGNANMLKTVLQSLDMLTDRMEIEQKMTTNISDSETIKSRIEQYKSKNKKDERSD